METIQGPDVSRHDYRVTWSVEDGEFVATCAEFPSLSWMSWLTRSSTSWDFGSARCVLADPGPVGRASRLVGRGQARFDRFCSGPEERSPTGTRVVSPVQRHASCAVTDCTASEVASPRRPLSRVETGLSDGAALGSRNPRHGDEITRLSVKQA
jgi:hypothetical protein